MWPSRWFTPISGAPVANAIAFAPARPTTSAPTSPGPIVTATASMSAKRHPACSSASSRSGFSASTWARLASSGTTPPKRACRSTWLEMTFESATRSSTTATAVSSQEVSIPRTFTERPSRASALGERVHELAELAAERRVADPVDPHDERVLADLLVVVLAHADGSEPEPPVQPLRAPVRHAHLERDRLGPHLDGVRDEVVQEPRADLVPVVERIHGDVRDVGLLAVADETAVADDLPVHAGDEVAAIRALGHLREEQVRAPRTRVDLTLDRHDAAQVAAAHPRHLKTRRRDVAGPKRSPHPISSGTEVPRRTTGRAPRAPAAGSRARRATRPAGGPRPPRRTRACPRPPRAPAGTGWHRSRRAAPRRRAPRGR